MGVDGGGRDLAEYERRIMKAKGNHSASWSSPRWSSVGTLFPFPSPSLPTPRQVAHMFIYIIVRRRQGPSYRSGGRYAYPHGCPGHLVTMAAQKALLAGSVCLVAGAVRELLSFYCFLCVLSFGRDTRDFYHYKSSYLWGASIHSECFVLMCSSLELEKNPMENVQKSKDTQTRK